MGSVFRVQGEMLSQILRNPRYHVKSRAIRWFRLQTALQGLLASFIGNDGQTRHTHELWTVDLPPLRMN